MIVQFARWGNSLALRIPNVYAKEIAASAGVAAELSVSQGKLVVAPVAIPPYDLASLVACITDENRHGEVGGHYAVGEEFA